MTKTGKNRGIQLDKHPNQKLIHLLLPLDFLPCVRRGLRQANPHALIIAESEIWPNLLREAKRIGTKIVLVNGRISERSFKAYRLLRFFFKDVLNHIDHFIVQSKEESLRLTSLGVQPERISIVGSLKADYTAKTYETTRLHETRPEESRGVSTELNSPLEKNEISLLRKRLGIPEESRPIVCGSTRPGEEQIILEMFKDIKKKISNSCLIIAPRHPKRFKEVETLLKESDLRWMRKTDVGVDFKPALPWEVLLLNTLGELDWVYGAGEVAFVGGSLLPFGGHNLLEPARWRIPVLFGPHIENAREMGEELVRRGGGIKVQDSQDLTRKTLHLLSNSETRRKMGEAAFEILQSNRGTTQLTFQKLMENGIFSGKEIKPFSINYSAIPIHKVILLPLTLLYLIGYRFWILLYQLKILKKSSLNTFVISVGNITTGGTGKTPFVQFLASQLQQKGKKVAILTRGYRRNSSNHLTIQPFNDLTDISPDEVGDEPFLLSKNTNGIPVVVGKNRVNSGLKAKQEFGTDIFILDDGFQYQRLNRDLNIVLIDNTDPFGNGHLLPGGRLREPISSLKRADLFILTRTDIVSNFHHETRNSRFGRISPASPSGGHHDIQRTLHSINPDAPILEAIHNPIDVKKIPTPTLNQVQGETQNESHPLSWLEGKKIIALSSIGNPAAFEETLEGLGAVVIENIRFRDHHRYTSRDLERIGKKAKLLGAEAIVTTEKDEVRLVNVKFPMDQKNVHNSNPSNPLNPLNNFYTLRVEMKITKGEEILWKMMNSKL
jgi:3-deoxy-D-manno-octulosonic-acid transferase/tetraacyldisaccharide-1-P 4'-kinase